jgi:GntR family transcriptional regulator
MAPPGAPAKDSSDDRGVTRRAAVAREPAAAPRTGIDPASPTPLYHQIFSLLRGQIYDGQYPGGSFLPSEQELSAEFNVSRITAKRALDELAADGLVVREQGRGTRVCINTHSTSVRGSVKGLVHSLHANGRGSVQLLDFGYLPASEAIAAQLGLNVGDEVQRAIRIWHGEEGPFSHLTTFVPGRLGRSWTGEDLMRRPLISLLENTGVTIARAEERITAVLADAGVAARLAVDAGAPLLMITRTVFDTQDHSVEHLTALYPPERYQYSVSLGP